MTRLVHVQAQHVGQRDQPRVPNGTREEGFGTAGGSVATRRSVPTTCTRDLL